MAKLLTLQSLVCADPEDWVVGDEARLEVFVDNLLQDTIRGNLGAGQTLTINRTYTFNSTVDVRLWDEDVGGPVDPDDFLGNTVIGTGVTTNATRTIAGSTFLGGPWSYTLMFSVADIPVVVPPSPNLPISIPGVEVVQTVQRPDNTVRLSQGKRTMVRVFVDSGLRDGSNAGAGANVRPGVGGTLTTPSGTFAPLNGTINAQPGPAIDRDNQNHSLNFEIPLADTIGNTLSLTARVFEAGQQGDTTGTRSATATRTVTFEPRPLQVLTPVLVADTSSGNAAPAPTFAAYLGSLTGATRRYPVAEGGFVLNPAVTISTGLDLTGSVGWGALLLRLATVGLIGAGSTTSGIRTAVVPNNGAYALNGIGAPQVLGSPASFAARVGLQGTFAHEMGHCFGLGHAPCCLPAGEAPQAGLPAGTEEPGFDVPGNTVIPRGRGEIMSYCGDTSACPGPTRWPSIAFWDSIRGRPPIP